MTNRSPVVSVCVPTYNSARFIAATVQSILDQTFPDFEVIVVDDASTDGTAEIVAAMEDPRLRLIRNRENLGAVANWNKAVGPASGTYVKLVCGDDLLASDCLETQVEAMERDQSVVIVAGRRDIIDEQGEVLFAGRGLRGLVGIFDGRTAIARTVRSGTNQLGEPACVLLRAATMKSVGEFNGHVPYMIDLEYWVRMLRYGRLAGLETTVAAFRVVGTSWSNTIAWRQSAQAIRLFRELRRSRHVGWVDAHVGGIRSVILGGGRLVLYRLLARRRRVGAGPFA